MRALLLATLLVWPALAQAQYWATKDACTVETVQIDPDAFAPANLGVLETEAAAMPNPLGRFWRIQSPDGAVSHLWGTMHSSDPLILDLPGIVLARIGEARVVAVETDFIAPSRRLFEHRLGRDDWYRPMRSGFKFDSLGIDPRVRDWIRSRTHGLGWGRNAPDSLSFGGLATLLLSDPCDDFAMDVLPGQDGRIQMLGMIAGADVLSLEHPEAVTRHLNDPENTELAVALLSIYGSYLNPDRHPSDRATGFALYKSGQIGLSRAWDRSDLVSFFGPEAAARHLELVDDYLLTDRNRTFLETAQPELRKGGVFMAIGAYHLPGRHGMVEMLRDAGYKVTRIPLPQEVP